MVLKNTDPDEKYMQGIMWVVVNRRKHSVITCTSLRIAPTISPIRCILEGGKGKCPVPKKDFLEVIDFQPFLCTFIPVWQLFEQGVL